MESYKNIFKATSLFGGVSGLKLVLNLVRNKIAAELLGPAGTGLNSIYNETRELIHSTTNLGLDISGIRNISKSYEKWRTAKVENEKLLYHEELLDEISLLRSWVMLLAIVGSVFCLTMAMPLSFFTFQNLEHTLGYMFLSPAVGFSTLVCGELTILKATRHLKLVATLSVVFVLFAIVISLPLYYFLRINGVLPALVLLFLAEVLAVLYCSYKHYKPHFCFQFEQLKKGLPVLKLGIAFAIAGMFTHGTQLGIKSFFNTTDDGTALIGLYAAGYGIVMQVAGVLFAALDNDFFPRLAGIFGNLEERRTTVYQQIKVTLPISLLAVAICIPALPILLPLLNSEQYLPAIPMAQFAMAGLVFRAIYLPFSYLNLAAGASRTFLCLELISNAIILACVIPCYYYFEYSGYNGLTGVGLGLLIAQIIDTIISYAIAKIKYGL